jgi:hypothetical protein
MINLSPSPIPSSEGAALQRNNSQFGLTDTLNMLIIFPHLPLRLTWPPLGLALEPGQVVLAGSFIRPIETRKGDTIQADYGSYGSVSCYFA